MRLPVNSLYTQIYAFIGISVLMLCLQPWVMELCFHVRYNVSSPYRLYLGHFVHQSIEHWLLNAAALMLFPFTVSRVPPRLLLVLLMVLPWAISLSFNQFVFFQPVFAYVGFSGVLHGLYAGALGYVLLTKLANRFDVLLLIGLMLKLVIEQFSVFHFAELISVARHVYPPAHVFGALYGIAMAVLYYAIQRLTAYKLNSTA